MKKFLTAILCIGLMAVTVTGCGYQDALSNQSSTQETTASADGEKTEIKDTDYKNNLDGLCKYFAAKGYINVKKDTNEIDDSNGVMTKMDASLIGAKEGKKFATTVGGKNVTIELYEYDIKNLNDKANEIIASVEKDGTFVILDLPKVSAELSDNGKYLLIYTDNSINAENPDKESDNYKHREEVIKTFKAFHK